MPDEIVTVLLNEFHTLIEKTMLLLGHASNSIPHKRQQNIASHLIKDSRKAKYVLRGKATFLQKHNQNLLWKRFAVYIIKKEKWRKKAKEIFKVKIICLVLRSPFRRAPRHYLYHKTHMMGANSCTQKISENQDNFRKHQSSR